MSNLVVLWISIGIGAVYFLLYRPATEKRVDRGDASIGSIVIENLIILACVLIFAVWVLRN